MDVEVALYPMDGHRVQFLLVLPGIVKKIQPRFQKLYPESKSANKYVTQNKHASVSILNRL
jgi:hypothetical protein